MAAAVDAEISDPAKWLKAEFTDAQRRIDGDLASNNHGWRNGRDLNPRGFDTLALSRRAHLATLPPFRLRIYRAAMGAIRGVVATNSRPWARVRSSMTRNRAQPSTELADYGVQTCSNFTIAPPSTVIRKGNDAKTPPGALSTLGLPERIVRNSSGVIQ